MHELLGPFLCARALPKLLLWKAVRRQINTLKNKAVFSQSVIISLILLGKRLVRFLFLLLVMTQSRSDLHEATGALKIQPRAPALFTICSPEPVGRDGIVAGHKGWMVKGCLGIETLSKWMKQAMSSVWLLNTAK